MHERTVVNKPVFALLLVLALWAVGLHTGGTGQAQELDRAAMQTELLRLSKICSELGLEREAALSASWLAEAHSEVHCLYLPVEQIVGAASAPGKVDAVQKPAVVGAAVAAQADDLTRARDSWHKHFNSARLGYAQWLFTQASERAAAGDEAEAFGLLWQVLRQDAQHAQAQRILGTLVSAAQVKPRLRKATAMHPDFGWPAGSYSRIETPNFLITTRAGARESVEMAQAMEQFYALWRQVFYPLWAPPGVLTKRFDGRNVPWERGREMQVILLRDRADYLQVLGVSERNAAISVGYYEPQLQKSFFYAGDSWQATLFHELTHQLLAEATNADVDRQAGAAAGIWLIEGIALYMESLTDRGTYWTLGGFCAPRLQTARYRAVRDGYWANWDEFTQAGREQWKEDPQIALLYTQATGLTHLFMDQLQQPAARQALFRALVSAYHSSSDFEPLRALLGDSDETLKLAYQQALTMTDAQVNQLCQLGLPCASLVLAGSELQSATWSELSKLSVDLEWFDASFSNATTADLQWLRQAKKLRRLSVEGTHCDGDLLKLVGELRELNELDLTGCPIDDQSLKELRGHPSLEILWLDGTRVTAASVELLDSLPKLAVCHCDAIGWTKPQQP